MTRFPQVIITKVIPAQSLPLVKTGAEIHKKHNIFSKDTILYSQKELIDLVLPMSINYTNKRK